MSTRDDVSGVTSGGQSGRDGASGGERAAEARAERRPPVFAMVRLALSAWRQAVALEFERFAGSDLPKGKLRRDWRRKGKDFLGCGRVVSGLGCNGCGTVNAASGTLIATCGLRVCPVCARRRAQRLRRRLSLAWKHRTKDRRASLYFLTFTLRYDPSDPADVTVDALMRRKLLLLEGWMSVWRQYLKPRSHAAVRAVEVGGSGAVHLHVLYYGLRPDVNEVRLRWMFKVGDSPMIDVKYVRKPEKGIVELAKYVTKGSSPAKADVLGGKPGGVMDPRLAVRVEIAFSGDRLIQCYGDWRKIDVDADQPDDGERAEERELGRAACPHCGLVGDWHTVTMYTDQWLAHLGADRARWKPRIGRAGPPAVPLHAPSSSAELS